MNKQKKAKSTNPDIELDILVSYGLDIESDGGNRCH